MLSISSAIFSAGDLLALGGQAWVLALYDDVLALRHRVGAIVRGYVFRAEIARAVTHDYSVSRAMFNNSSVLSGFGSSASSWRRRSSFKSTNSTVCALETSLN